MGKDILPDDPEARRMRGRPRLRWLANEEGARWAILAELGRIGDPRTFEEAVEWALENRPRPEEAAAHVRRLGSGTPCPEACGSLARQTALSVPRLRGATGKEERRC
jgi:hypothetical protein